MISYADMGRTEKLRKLPSNGTEQVNYQNIEGCTALFYSAQRGHVSALQMLIAATTDVNTTMTVDSCHSALTISALKCNIPMYELLLASGADTAHKALPQLKEPYKTVGGTAEQILHQQTTIKEQLKALATILGEVLCIFMAQVDVIVREITVHILHNVND